MQNERMQRILPFISQKREHFHIKKSALVLALAMLLLICCSAAAESTFSENTKLMPRSSRQLPFHVKIRFHAIAAPPFFRIIANNSFNCFLNHRILC